MKNDAKSENCAALTAVCDLHPTGTNNSTKLL